MVTKRKEEFASAPAKRLRSGGEAGGDERHTRKTKVKTTPFPFMRLPPELRNEVYGYIVVKNREFHMGHDHMRDFEFLTRLEKDQSVDKRDTPTMMRSQMSLFLVSKIVSAEAQGVLFRNNLFTFTIDSDSHPGRSLKSLKIFGQFGVPERLHMLRELRHIRIFVDLTSRERWSAIRHRARLDYFISILKEHSDDENQKSLLKRLQVCFRTKRAAPYAYHPSTFIYNLESLATLRGIENVEFSAGNKIILPERAYRAWLEKMHYPDLWSQTRFRDEVRSSGLHGAESQFITGQGAPSVWYTLPKWYTDCLKLCIQGQEEDIPQLDYPDILVEKLVKAGYGKKAKEKEMVYRTTKRWMDPTLNWGAFAERNGIEIPSDWAAMRD